MKNIKEIIRFIKFALFSASAALIELGAFALLNEVTHWRYWPCYLIALVLSVLWNFWLNRRYTFKSNAKVAPAVLMVLAYYAVFTPISSLGGDYLVETAGWNEYLVTIINMLLNFVTEYLFQRYVVYKNQIDTMVSSKKS